MSARTRLPRQAAQAAKYTFDEPSDDEPEDPRGGSSSDEDARPTKRRKKGKDKAAGKKGRASKEDDEDDEERYIRVWIREPSPEKVEYEVKGVDFSKVLPVEVTVEILSSFHPKTLYSLSFLSKTFHAIITSAAFKPILRRAFLFRDKAFAPARFMYALYGWLSDSDSDSEDEGVLQTQLPKIDAEEVDPYRLAMLLYEPSCQICRGNEGATYDPHLLLRICSACRRRNLKLISNVRKSDELGYLHPSTLDAVITTARSVDSPGSNGRERALYVPHLEAVSQRLDELAHKGNDKKSTLTTGSPATPASPTSSAVTTARRSTKRQAAQGSTSMRIQAFVLERKKMQKEGDDLSACLRKYSLQLECWLSTEERRGRKAAERAVGLRWHDILNRIEEEGVFDYLPSDVWLEHRLKAHPLVNRTDPLNDEVWTTISPVLYREIARITATKLAEKYEEEKKRVDWAAPQVAIDLLKKPAEVSDAGWVYLEAALTKHLDDLKAELARRQARRRDADDLAKKQDRLDKKVDFFRKRYSQVIEQLPTEGAKAYAPRFLDFLRLPSVRNLYELDDYAVERRKIKDDQHVFQDRLDEVFEDVGAFAADLRLDVLKHLLSTYTDDDAGEVDALDVDALADPQYGDDYFNRPSNWLMCSRCKFFGSIVDVLQHAHAEHELNPPPLTLADQIEDEDKDPSAVAGNTPKWLDEAPEPPYALSLEVACAWSAILELSGVDGDSSTSTKGDIDLALKGCKLVWENVPKRWYRSRGRRTRYKWQDMIETVNNEARWAGESTVIEPPIIALLPLTPAEQRRAERVEQRKQAKAGSSKQDGTVEYEQSSSDEEDDSEGAEGRTGGGEASHEEDEEDEDEE